MVRIVIFLVYILPFFASADEFSNSNELMKLYKPQKNIAYPDLVIDVKGYKVPTRAAFRGWMLMNRAEDQVQTLANELFAAGVKEVPLETMPLHLILLQGTDWRLKGTSIFTLPDKKQVPMMVRTLKFVQTHVEPLTGPLIPVSGDRDDYYNTNAGGAPRSKHLDFCALDLVPVRDIDRKELHKILWDIYLRVGRENSMGMGLYSGVRFHIDTCGYRNW